MGNLTASGSVDVTFYATTTGNIAGGVVVGEKRFGVNINPWASSGTLTVPVAMPTNPASRTYTLIASIVPTGFTDNNAVNDTQVVTGSVTVLPGTVDLHIFSVSNPFGTAANPGDTGKSTVLLENLGALRPRGRQLLRCMPAQAAPRAGRWCSGARR